MKKIIHQPWGGLGDNLQYSTLPELFSKQGYDVYISSNNAYRSYEIFDLVWKLNPFIKGITNEAPNCGGDICYNRIDKNRTIIFNQEICHNLSPENDIPKIYYKPEKLEQYKDIILIDISAHSSDPTIPYNFSEYLKEKYKNKTIVVPNFIKQVKSKKTKNFKFDDQININSIFEYTNIINSCKYFYCSFSGQSVLASTVNQKNTTVFIRKEWKNIDWCFPNLNYQIVQ